MNKYFFIICLTLCFNYQAIADSSYDRGKEKSVTCSACHGGDGNSNNKMYPRLAGQYKNYLIHNEVKNIEDFQLINTVQVLNTAL